MENQPSGPGWLDKRIKGDGPLVIVDGGVGSELQRRGAPMDDACWSAMAALDNPDKLRQVHEEFIIAGADVIITNTFSSGRHMLEPMGAGELVLKINTEAVRLAREAIDNVASTPVAIAGSICEWTSAHGHPKWGQSQAIADALTEQATLLADAGADIICIEMAQNRVLSELAVEAALSTNLPVWLGVSYRKNQFSESLSVNDDASENFKSFVEALVNKGVGLVNIMHTPVPDVAGNLDTVSNLWDGPIGVYPESGYFNMPDWQFVDVIEPDQLVEAAKPWSDNHNLRVLGGCCGIQPNHIRALKAAFG